MSQMEYPKHPGLYRKSLSGGFYIICSRVQYIYKILRTPHFESLQDYSNFAPFFFEK